MFDFSLGELMVTAAVALVVIGPEKLPKVARTVGAMLGRAQRYVHNVKADLQRDMQLDELRQTNPLEELQRLKNDLHQELHEGIMQEGPNQKDAMQKDPVPKDPMQAGENNTALSKPLPPPQP